MVVKIESLTRISANVFRVNNNNRYVLKVVPIRSAADERAFDTEVMVGETPGIERIGVRTRAWYKHKNNGYGVILIDHVEMGHKNVESMTVENYLQNNRANKDVFVRKLERCLTDFYNLTGRFHGDLHPGNVMVVVRNKKKVDVRVIDYGSTVQIMSTKTKIKRTFAEWTRLIRKTFESKPIDKKQRYHPIGSGLRVKHDRSTGVPFRMNKNVLNYYALLL